MSKREMARVALLLPLLVVILTKTNSDSDSLHPSPVVTLHAKEEPLREVLLGISNQTGSRLKIEGRIPDIPVSLSANGKHLFQVMDALCENEVCRWKWESYLVVWPAGDPTPEWISTRSCPGPG
jgi:hypothetical protein